MVKNHDMFLFNLAGVLRRVIDTVAGMVFY